MFKIGLLTSTAMTAVALLLSGVPAGAYPQTDMHVASRDRNTRFLCTYGHLNVSQWFSGGGISYSGWARVAVPITGHGQTVTQIGVVEAKSARTYYSVFTAGIYSNTASGFPGKPMAVGTGSISFSCGQVTISIPATKLKRKTKYW
ncbi:MAG TPA: hypothetical protein VKR31_14825 [Rhizomicrobium sp.]|nr:hypothetical protein [Rhizomicrobium sp.]